MRTQSRAAIILVSALAIILIITSCASSMTDEEARSILAELIPKSQELNEIFWGDGLMLADKDAQEVKSVTAAQYYKVAEDSKYKTIAQLKAAAEEVFTAGYLETVYAMAFEGFHDFEPRFSETDGVLSMDIKYENYDFDTVIFTETARVTETAPGLIRVEVDYEDGGERDVMRISLRLQDGKWLIDSPTY